MSQAVAIYLTYASDVLLICWFGDQLTQYVRKIVPFLAVAPVRIIRNKCNQVFNKQKFIFLKV
jgi:hypothetical protein